jgi:hypothetical protein
MNGGSSDRFVAIYNVTVTMYFDGNTHNSPCSADNTNNKNTTTTDNSINSENTNTITNTTNPLTDPSPLDTLITHTIPFDNVMLGVVMSGWFNLKQDRVLIDTITQHSALLQSVTLSLAGYQSNGQMSRGMDAWLLAVVVTAPNALVVQSGGFEWLAQKDLFYNRRWVYWLFVGVMVDENCHYLCWLQ